MDQSARKPLLDQESISLPQELSNGTRARVFSTAHRVAGEMLGTFFLMFSVCGSIMAGWDIMGQAAVVGFSLIMIISSVGHISGAHLNPAITFAFAATKQCPWSQVAWYIGGQLLAGTFATWVAKIVYNASSQAAIVTAPSGGWGQAFAMEVVLTLGLSFLATAINSQPHFNGGIQGALAIGLTVASNMLLGGEISGASMNPMRSLAPAIVQNSYPYIWIYLLAPMIGATIGALLFKLIQLGPISYKEIIYSTCND